MASLGVTMNVLPEDLQNIPPTGPCIICSNHPYGCIDGLMMIAAVGKVRKDVKIMTNFILSALPNLSDHFIPVDPFSVGKPKSVRGVITSLEHLNNGGCLVLFPAGEVSSNRNPDHVVRDVEWQSGAIHPLLRTARLIREMFNKSGRTVNLKFGKAVKPVEFASYPTPEELASYLRNRTYALEGMIYGEEPSVPRRRFFMLPLHV